MIYVVYHRQKQTCALCATAIVKRTAAMFDPKKTTGNKYVHLVCWEKRQKEKGIELKEPQF